MTLASAPLFRGAGLCGRAEGPTRKHKPIIGVNGPLIGKYLSAAQPQPNPLSASVGE
jgi:hypothetical protein